MKTRGPDIKIGPGGYKWGNPTVGKKKALDQATIDQHAPKGPPVDELLEWSRKRRQDARAAAAAGARQRGRVQR